jgi:hypothetical protein
MLKTLNPPKKLNKPYEARIHRMEGGKYKAISDETTTTVHQETLKLSGTPGWVSHKDETGSLGD